ncbi:hypothetical protein SNE40_004616 [Patella caerulea]|uniref:Uncharacterized protein n=1 Tax=Patella caerulea TaxID=87958 RepID=A0AAN8K9W7_PATCE
MLEGWDISQTESLLHRIEAYKEKRQEENRQRREAEQNKLEGQIETAKKEYETKQKQLNTAYCELNKRILEHDLASASGFDRPELTLQAIHDAELDLEVIKMDTEKAKEKLSQARLKLREQQKQNVDGDLDDNLPGVKVMIRELDEVLMRDVGNKIKDSGKWPFIIDTSGQAAIFLRYRDTNMLNALRPVDMEPETIRMALLGAIRFGKPFIIDMMEVDMFDVCVDRFDEIQKGLMDALLDKSLLEGEKFMSLTKETDGAEYQPTRHFMVDNFKFFFITSNSYPNDGLLNRTYPIRIILPK